MTLSTFLRGKIVRFPNNVVVTLIPAETSINDVTTYLAPTIVLAVNTEQGGSCEDAAFAIWCSQQMCSILSFDFCPRS